MENHNDHHMGQDEVSITVNGVEHNIHRGSHTVHELKEMFEIPSAEQFAEVKDNKVVDLSDDTRVTIKGGEVFISYTPTGQSS